MALVRVLKNLGFEQAGEIVDYRGNLEEALARGEVEVLDGDPRPVVNSQTVTEEPTEPEAPVEVPEPETPEEVVEDTTEEEK